MAAVPDLSSEVETDPLPDMPAQAARKLTMATVEMSLIMIMMNSKVAAHNPAASDAAPNQAPFPVIRGRKAGGLSDNMPFAACDQRHGSGEGWLHNAAFDGSSILIRPERNPAPVVAQLCPPVL